MAITFYAGSGSPFAWRVWLSLEHKELPYELKMLSFSAGDLRTPEYRAINPRGKVPAIVDDGFTLWESGAIVEYLADRYANHGPPLWPGDAHQRAVARRLSREADLYLAGPMDELVDQVLLRAAPERDAKAIAGACEAYAAELGWFERQRRGEFLAGPLSAADFTLYPMLALLRRIDGRAPELGLKAKLPAGLATWMQRIEGLPYYDKTFPPHWR